ncbi:MAG: nucleotidyltransferase [Steroidobacteraceae bacterium]
MSELNGLLQRLSDVGVEFVVVGGVAAVLHGSSMVTRDLDVCATLSSENLQKLRDALRDLHPVHRIASERRSFLESSEPGVSLRNLYLQTDLGALDILGEITGVGDFRQVLASAIDVDLFGRKVKVIALDQLIKAKEAVGRHKDLLAVAELRAISAGKFAK